MIVSTGVSSTVAVLLIALCAVAGYLLGGVETAVIISKIKYHDDVRQHGSGNAGTTNMLRVFGMAPAIYTFVGDLIKGIIAVLIGRLLYGDLGGYICGFCAVLGHDYPIFFGMKGGKGVATTLGIAWMIDPIAAAVATVLGFLIIYISQTVSIGSLIGITIYMAAVVTLNSTNTALIVLCSLLWALIIWRHRENLKRIFSGTESKLFKRKKNEK